VIRDSRCNRGCCQYRDQTDSCWTNCRRWESNPHALSGALDFESSVSAIPPLRLNATGSILNENRAAGSADYL
jgi:hypothetical protein